MGESYTSESGRTVTISEPSVSKIIEAIHEQETYITGADGQFISVDIGLSDRSTDQMLNAAIFDISGYDITPISPNRLCHPTPEPPAFEPTLVISIDGQKREATKTTYWGRDSGFKMFDVPAEPATEGSVMWTDPEETVHWDLPKTVLSKLSRNPALRLHSLSGSFVEKEEVKLAFEVENPSTRTATYRAHYYSRRAARRGGGGGCGMGAFYPTSFEHEMPPESTRTFEASYGVPEYQNEVTMVFDDGLNRKTITLRRETSTPTAG